MKNYTRFMVIDEIRFYQLLKAKIGETEAEAIVHIIDKKVTTKFDQSKNELATKEDVLTLRVELKQDIGNLRAEFKQDIANLRAELMRSIYLTNLGQLIAIIASVVSIILALKK